MGTDTTGVAEELGTVLGGRVASLRRLSGGASRVTSAFDLEMPSGTLRPLILQQVRGGGLAPRPDIRMEAGLLRAARGVGVPVPEVVAAGADDGLDPGWLVVERLEGETIPRRILRGEGFASAVPTLTDQTARALAAIHSIDTGSVHGLPPADPLEHPLDFLDALHAVRPVLELGARWLARGHQPTDRRVVVHGDFRMGNFLVDASGLRAVLDWELAHLGDPAEDIGWLCARAWRFGGRGRVGGFGDLDRFLTAYAAAGGRVVDVDRIRWWEAYATVKWAVICLLQASSHLSGASRSVELAAIGRRVCENEWDLLALVGVAMPSVAGAVAERVRFGRGALPVQPALRASLEGRVGGGGARVPRQGHGLGRGGGPLRGPRGAERPVHRRTRAGPRAGRGRRPRASASRSWDSTTTRRWRWPSVPVGTTRISPAWVRSWPREHSTSCRWTILRILTTRRDPSHGDVPTLST